MKKKRIKSRRGGERGEESINYQWEFCHKYVKLTKLTKSDNPGKGNSLDAIGIQDKQDYSVHAFDRKFIE